MRTGRVIVSAALLLALAACTTSPAYRSRYLVALSEVERTPPPADGAVWPKGCRPSQCFKDELIAAHWELGREEMKLKFRNQSRKPLKIRWDRARFVSCDGEEHELVDRNVHPASRVRPKPPAVVEPGSKLRASVYPADYLHGADGEFPGYPAREVLPQVEGMTVTTRQEAEAHAEGHKGETIQIILPVEGGEGSWEYRFTFTLLSPWGEKLPWA